MKKRHLLAVVVALCTLVSLLQVLFYKREPVVVAVIDSEINWANMPNKDGVWVNTLEEIDGKDNDGNGYIDDVNGYNFLASKGVVVDDANAKITHGTICAKLMIDAFEEKADSRSSISIMSVVVMDGDVFRDSNAVEGIIEGIKYAEDNGARICNLSLSTDDYNEELQECMQHSSMLFVVAAGNGNTRGICLESKPVYPASFNLDNQITVACLKENGRFAKSSNYSNKIVDVATYGGYALRDGSNYVYGSSFATARTSGIIAALTSRIGAGKAELIKNELYSNAIKSDELAKYVVDGRMIITHEVQDNYNDR